jgi:hypothetical protein
MKRTLILSIILPKGVSNIFFDMNNCYIACPMRSLGYVLITIIYFLIGALIGWIVGKIKSPQ